MGGRGGAGNVVAGGLRVVGATIIAGPHAGLLMAAHLIASSAADAASVIKVDWAGSDLPPLPPVA